MNEKELENVFLNNENIKKKRKLKNKNDYCS